MAGEAVGYVFRPGEGRQIDLGNFTMTVKGDAESTSGLFTLLEADEPPEFGPPNLARRSIWAERTNLRLRPSMEENLAFLTGREGP